MSPALINKVLTTLSCANKYKTTHNRILSVIDFSKPSSQKRLWIFDLNDKKLLFNTHVAHGIKSGILSAYFFSNTNNSKASSIGLYITEEAYHGRYGLALRLAGLERGFNDNARNRAVVIHGGWYVNERFVKKYGRTGRSWGCPAVPLERVKPIINTIKDNNLLVAYYPSEDWFIHSKYLNCENLSHRTPDTQIKTELDKSDDNRASILFVTKNNNHTRETNEPVVVIAADDYQRAFNDKPPLKRMLRRQIKNMEYIALSSNELDIIINEKPELLNTQRAVFFIIPVIKNIRGYHGTEMEFVNYGEITSIIASNQDATNQNMRFTVNFTNHPSITLQASSEFIRWLGL